MEPLTCGKGDQDAGAKCQEANQFAGWSQRGKHSRLPSQRSIQPLDDVKKNDGGKTVFCMNSRMSKHNDKNWQTLINVDGRLGNTIRR